MSVNDLLLGLLCVCDIPMQRDYSLSEKKQKQKKTLRTLALTLGLSSVFTGKHRLKYSNNDHSAMAFGMTQAQVKGGDHVMQVQGHCSATLGLQIKNEHPKKKGKKSQFNYV